MTKETMPFGVEEHEIVNRIIMRFSDEAEAWDWLNRTPLPGHGCATARDLVREGRAQEVLAYIDSVNAGVHA
jgi:acyl-CoA reductase-like NAD-dependent aldehyde dehydrogenase